MELGLYSSPHLIGQNALSNYLTLVIVRPLPIWEMVSGEAGAAASQGTSSPILVSPVSSVS
jgi:hypothetical protein